MSDEADHQPKRRLYTGWRVVGANSVVWSLQSMIWVQGYGNMAVELRDQFGWSKSFLSFVYAGTRAETAVFGPVQGRAIGTLGIKKVMRAGAVLGLIGFLAISWADTRGEFVAAMLILSLGMSMIGFLTITSSTVRWFERRRAPSDVDPDHGLRRRWLLCSGLGLGLRRRWVADHHHHRWFGSVSCGLVGRCHATALRGLPRADGWPRSD